MRQKIAGFLLVILAAIDDQSLGSINPLKFKNNKNGKILIASVFFN